MRARRIFLVLALASVVFVVDVALPLGVAGGVPYIACVLLSLNYPGHRLLIATVVLGSLLTVLGYFASPDGADLHVVWLNRTIAVLSIWAVALVGYQRKLADERLRRALAQRGVLLRELHHRVKNNLQVVSSILSLQSADLEDDASKRALMESRARIEAIAQLHQSLYRSGDLSVVDLGAYLSELVAGLAATLADRDRIQLLCHAESVQLDLDVGVPCGLLVNELVTNSYKHAFPDGASGTITVELRADDVGRCHLVVNDDGVGLPEKPSGVARGLGMKLIDALSIQLGGEPVWRTERGTHFEVVFSCR